MGGMYRVIMGEDPAAPLLCEAYEIRRRDCGRYRDLFVIKQNRQYRVCLLTRNGEAGFNAKNEYQQTRDLLAKHPYFVREYSDLEDASYLTTEFSVPEKFKPLIEKLELNGLVHEKHKMDYLREKIDKLRNHEYKDPEVKRLMEWGDKVFKPMLQKALKEEVDVTSLDGQVEIKILPKKLGQAIVDKED